MEFWGVEVKAGESVKVEASQEIVIHISQAALGEVKKDKKNELVPIFLNVDDQKLVIGSLSTGKISQIAYDLVLDRNFELSHNWKNGSIYFCGYKSPMESDDCCGTDFSSDSDSDFGSDLPVIAKENGKPEPKNANSTVAKSKITIEEPTKDDDEDSDDDSDDFDYSESSDSEGGPVNVSEKVSSAGKSSAGGSSEDDSSEDDSSDEDAYEEAPKKVEQTKKRKAEEASKTPVPEKKAKLVTPQKTGENKKGGVHVATPYPSKKSKQSGGQAARKSKNKDIYTRKMTMTSDASSTVKIFAV